MRRRAYEVLIVLTLVVVVWLYAEAESLTEATLTGRITLEVDPRDAGAILVAADEREDRVAVSVRGPRGSVDRLERALEQTIALLPGMPGLPDTPGEHEARLREVFEQHPDLGATGAEIESVRPATVRYEVVRLVTRRAPIEPALRGVRTDGPVETEPATAEVRLPEPLARELGARLTVLAPLPEGFEPAAGPQRVDATLELPPSVASEPGVELLTERASLAFTAAGTTETRRLPTVPVQVMLPPVEMDRYRVEIDPETQFVAVTLTGPRAVLERLESGEGRLVGVIALSDREIARGVTEKPVRVLVLRDGAIEPLPETVSASAETETVRFAVTPRDEGPGG